MYNQLAVRVMTAAISSLWLASVVRRNTRNSQTHDHRLEIQP